MSQMKEEDRRRVAIIGAGMSGLVSIKSCLDEGLEPTCFEQRDDIGGIWYYTDPPHHKQRSGIYKGMMTNLPKEIMTFSIFPFPDKDKPQFFPGEEYIQYLKDFMNHFDLGKYIRFNTEVIKVYRTSGSSSRDQWVVKVSIDETKDIQEHTFDAVMVCTGPLRHNKIPDIPGLDTFKGRIINAGHFRDPKVFEGKTVLVIGNNISASDIAALAAETANKVYWGTGQGTWLGSRYLSDNKEPWFYKMMCRSYLRSFITKFKDVIYAMCTKIIDHEKYGLGHDQKPFAGAPVCLNEELPHLVKSEKVVAKSGEILIKGFKAKFADGSEAEVDVIVTAVGYRPDYSFVDCEEFQGDAFSDLQLYKWTFPLQDEAPTLVTISPLPLIFTVIGAELQSRWAARVFAGKLDLPPLSQMKKHWKEIVDNVKNTIYGKIRTASLDFTLQVASELGVEPGFWSLLWQTWDPYLVYMVFWGPLLPIHFRLQGPGALDWAPAECYRAYRRCFTNLPTGKTAYSN